MTKVTNISVFEVAQVLACKVDVGVEQYVLVRFSFTKTPTYSRLLPTRADQGRPEPTRADQKGKIQDDRRCLVPKKRRQFIC